MLGGTRIGHAWLDSYWTIHQRPERTRQISEVNGENMRIAIASKGPELSSQVEPRFGRAKYIVIHDTGSPEPEVLDNQEISQLTGGAGVKAAEAVVEKNVDYVISQNFGPKALQVFKAANVKAAVVSGETVAHAIELVQRRQLNII